MFNKFDIIEKDSKKKYAYGEEIHMDYRVEHDTLGEVKVQADKYWGAQTERSKQNLSACTLTSPSVS